MTQSWLCRDDTDRERLLDMEQRLRPVRMGAMGVLALALLVSAPWVGWWTLAPLVFAAGLFQLAERRLPDSRRPEYWMFAAWAGAELTIAVSVVLAGAEHVAILSWLAIPVVTLSSRFSQRGVYLGVAVALGLLVAAAFAGSGSAVLDDPTIIGAPAAVIIAIAILSTALMQSDVEHRSEAIIDPLTGMLNRNALVTRADELSQQSDVTGQPVGMIVADLDNFKRVNDSLGHPAGDAVLTDVAYLMRKRLRAFDLSYRIGGEEFMVLLPGAEAEEAKEMAEELRKLFESEPVGGVIQMTMSFGVSGSQAGQRFDYDQVFAAADAALFEAKRAGRNQVFTRSTAGNGAGPALEPVTPSRVTA